MRRKTHRTETHIETHEIKIIRFGKRVDAESDDTGELAALIAEHVSEEDDDGRDFFERGFGGSGGLRRI